MKALNVFLIFFFVCFARDMYAQMSCLNSLPDTTRANCDRMLAGKCDPQYLGLVMLYEESREYASVFCDSLDQSITFINDNQEEVQLNIIEFRHEILSGTYNMRNVCEDDWSQPSSYCMDREVITISFTITGYSQRFLCQIFPRPQMKNPAPDRIGDYIEISYFYGESTSRYSTTIFKDFNVIIDQGTQTYGAYSNQVSKRKMKLLGERFENVITQTHKESKRKKFQFFLSKREGIVGFIDNESVLWRIKYRPASLED